MGNQKTFFISFFIVAVVLFALSVTSANPYIVSITSVTVNNVQTYGTNSYNSVAIFGGNSIPITVIFTANVDESNVRMSADLQGLSSDIQNQISVGDIVAGQTYIETLYLSVPTDVGDVQSGNINLVLNVWNGDSSVAETTQTIQLLDQRQSYNIQVMSINTVESVQAGNLFPVNIVLQNVGYNNLTNLYVIASIPSLSISRTAYFGSIQTTGGNDTIGGTIYLQMPYNVAPGTYTIQVQIENNNLNLVNTTTVPVTNEFQSNIIAENSSLVANIGQNAQYNLVLVNPTTNIQLYQIVPETVSGLTITGDTIVTVPAGSSETATLIANAASTGNYNVTVNAISGGQITGTAYLLLDAENGISNPVVILTIILAVLFFVLVAVLIVLVTRKPSKQEEEFSESYY